MDKREAARLVGTYATMVYRLAYARTGNRSDAEDVMQETFLTLLRKGPDYFESEEHAKAWLLRVAVQRTNDHFRRHRREVPLTEADLVFRCPEEQGEVLSAVLALPPSLRIPVHLFYYEDQTVSQVARTMGIGESAVKTRLFRARAKLRELLTEGGEDLVP